LFRSDTENSNYYQKTADRCQLPYKPAVSNEVKMTSQYFVGDEKVSMEEFAIFCEQCIDMRDFPLATRAICDVLIYERSVLDDACITDRRSVLSELHKALSYGPGVFIVKNLYANLATVDRATQIFEQDMHAQADSNVHTSHVSSVVNNGFIGRALQKMATKDPEVFCHYYANPTLAMICQAWLGPAWKMVSQVTQARPGGETLFHRDYHLGLQQSALASEFPIPAQTLSQYLSLQGFIAHTDMPVDSGPVRLLPWSHQYELGYMACRHPEFVDYFSKNFVQLPLHKGDGIFFNPALFHEAGVNLSETQQPLANLLHISSAFSFPVEEVDHHRVLKSIYPVMVNSHFSEQEINALTAVAAKGYLFPAALDSHLGVDEKVPKTQQQLLRHALSEKWDLARFIDALHSQTLN
jgi:ectoine hydroxylase-related dioxygenase (phytanoyl-CoA dioxygenase family)